VRTYLLNCSQNEMYFFHLPIFITITCLCGMFAASLSFLCFMMFGIGIIFWHITQADSDEIVPTY
jgi:hypothetical protein